MPAEIPGCVHTDLLRAGRIPDPFHDDNETRLHWIGHTEWVYETTFDAPEEADRVDLVALGLDTVATVSVNGTEVGSTANQHRSYRFDVKKLLRRKGNTLTVHFGSAYAYAEAVRAAVGERPNAYDEPFQYIRKMACNFGWDWGPTVVTAGIWRPIGLHAWSVARLAEVRPLVTVDGDTGYVEVFVTLDRAAPADLVLTLQISGGTATTRIGADEDSATVAIDVADARRWWPRGYGDAHRYDVTLTLSTVDGATLDTWHHKVGFRSVDLDTTPDADGSRFVLRVNDTPIAVRGVNWIPDDAFPTRVDRERYRTRFTQATDAGVNFLRVWGGGRYESAEFYDLADELGLLVGQDFLFACAAYPEEEPLAAEIAAEAHEQVVRLMPHPSLVMWVGNNENIWGFHDWDWQQPLDGRSWGGGYYFDLLPRTVARLDPTRPYWPGSPYSGTPDLHPNDPAHGTTHIWDVWNTHDYTRYREWRPRFVAEFGFQAPPAWATLRAAVSDDPLTPDSPGIAHHQKAREGNDKLLRGLAGHLPAPADFDDWHWATQLNQARAIRFGIEHFRALRPLCTGTILWQLNDCWPVTSWSAVDGDGRRKPLWYALRRAYADRLLTFQPDGEDLVLVAVNDGPAPWRESVEVVRHSFAGDALAGVTLDVDVPPGGAARLTLPARVATPGDPAAELMTAGDATWFFAEDVDLRYPEPAWEATVEGDTVRITAHTLLRDLALFPDRLDPTASVDDLLVTLLPGRSHTFRVRAGGTPDPAALTSRPVLRCANDLAHLVAPSVNPL
ncbi:beta-mannosidase [Virgisporangium aliadipatigenens]|uniref:beta-mannosidase n=1 Tax=Virgisporangium aliadipatigenens TaxID=741659 RepID=A0A8J3YDL8_9ACTN|nr:beta-mannosidase [Virgisporangium aliadipatigenens]